MEKSMQDLLKELNKSFGENKVIKVGDGVHTKIETTPTGVMSFDLALGGGFGVGRIIEIYGKESSGKTTLSLLAIAEAQKAGKVCGFIDVEQALDFEYAESLGVNINDLIVTQPDNGEEALEILDRMIESAMFGVIVFDSVAAIVPKAELEGEMGDQKMGVVARLMSQAMRKITGKTSKTKTTVIMINQTREKIGVIYGNPEVTTGGNALKFFSSQRVEVSKGTQLKQGEDIIGYVMKIRVVKNKIAPPFRKAEVNNMFGTGIDKFKDMLNIAVDKGLIARSGSWYSYEGTKLGQGIDKVAELVKDNPELIEELEEKIKAII